MRYKLTVNDRTYEVEVELAEPMMLAQYNAYAPAQAVAPVAPAAAPAVTAAPVVPAAPGEGSSVDAPMPGNILKVNVVPGQAVKEGDVLVVLEAMKMENEIMAPKGGTVTQVLVEKGASVDTGAPLVFIK